MSLWRVRKCSVWMQVIGLGCFVARDQKCKTRIRKGHVIVCHVREVISFSGGLFYHTAEGCII